MITDVSGTIFSMFCVLICSIFTKNDYFFIKLCFILIFNIENKLNKLNFY